MSRFERPEVRRTSAGWAVGAIAITAVVLVVLSGGSVEKAADEIDPGIGRDVIAAVGDPAGSVADALPLAEVQADVTDGLSPDTELGEGGFDTAAGAADTARIPPVTPDSFDPHAIAAPPPQPLELGKLLVTGDSMSIPLDSVLAQRLAGQGVEVVRDPKLGSAISDEEFLDWGQVSTAQVRDEDPDAVVMFIGAGEGFPLETPAGEVECCSPEYAAAYANRARQVMRTYIGDADKRLYWLSVPRSRNDRQWEISQLVNEAGRVAAVPWLAQIRTIDLVPIFTPGGVYRDSMEIDGEETIVRDSDGLHLTRPGAELAADAVMARLEQDFALGE